MPFTGSPEDAHDVVEPLTGDGADIGQIVADVGLRAAFSVHEDAGVAQGILQLLVRGAYRDHGRPVGGDATSRPIRPSSAASSRSPITTSRATSACPSDRVASGVPMVRSVASPRRASRTSISSLTMCSAWWPG